MRTYSFSGLNLEARLIDGKPLFKGDVVTKTLGFKNSSRTIKSFCKEHQYQSIYLNGQTGGRPTLMLTFGGVATLAMRSDKEDAIDFQCWVCDEVIPSIYEKGAYIDPTASLEKLQAAYAELSKVMAEKEALAADNKRLQNRIIEQGIINRDSKLSTVNLLHAIADDGSVDESLALEHRQKLQRALG